MMPSSVIQPDLPSPPREGDSSLRVGLFTDGDGFAGTERHVLELARGLSHEQVRVSIICPPVSVLADSAAREGIPVIAIAKRGAVDLGAVRLLARHLADGTLDVIHAHNGRTALLAALALARAKRGHIVTTQHFIDPARTQRRGPIGVIARGLHRWVGSRTAQVIAVSEAARAAMISRGEDETKITVVPNGISEPDTASFAPAAEIRRGLGLSPGTRLIVCAARLEPEKDVSTLIRAMALLGETTPDAVCVIAGEGSLAAHLAAEIAEAKLDRRVILAGFRSDVLALIHASDLFGTAEPCRAFWSRPARSDGAGATRSRDARGRAARDRGPRCDGPPRAAAESRGHGAGDRRTAGCAREARGNGQARSGAVPRKVHDRADGGRHAAGVSAGARRKRAG